MLLEPRIIDDERYALVVPVDDCQGTKLVTLQTYHSLEQLETGYADWKTLCKRERLTIPIPVENLDRIGNCRIMTEMLQT